MKRFIYLTVLEPGSPVLDAPFGSVQLLVRALLLVPHFMVGCIMAGLVPRESDHRTRQEARAIEGRLTLSPLAVSGGNQDFSGNSFNSECGVGTPH